MRILSSNISVPPFDQLQTPLKGYRLVVPIIRRSTRRDPKEGPKLRATKIAKIEISGFSEIIFGIRQPFSISTFYIPFDGTLKDAFNKLNFGLVGLLFITAMKSPVINCLLSFLRAFSSAYLKLSISSLDTFSSFPLSPEMYALEVQTPFKSTSNSVRSRSSPSNSGIQIPRSYGVTKIIGCFCH